jgi:hypothetical protein
MAILSCGRVPKRSDFQYNIAFGARDIYLRPSISGAFTILFPALFEDAFSTK